MSLRVKVYSDGADRASMLSMAQDERVHGLTTNPSLMKKAGVSDYVGFCKDILSQIRNKPISLEVFADDLNEMRRQALEIKTWGENVYVKIPVTNSDGKPTTDLVHELAHQGVKLNVTALFTLNQIFSVCQALKGGAPSVVSVFAGRIADTGRDPIPTMKAALEMCRSMDKNMELLWASTRELYNIVQADQIGCDIITVPFDLIKKMPMLGQDLVEMSLDTVKTFKKDADSAGFKL